MSARSCDTRAVGAITTVFQTDRDYLDAHWRARGADWHDHHRAMEASLDAIARSKEALARSERAILAYEAWWRGS
jgi:hypothetical protein